MSTIENHEQPQVSPIQEVFGDLVRLFHSIRTKAIRILAEKPSNVKVIYSSREAYPEILSRTRISGEKICKGLEDDSGLILPCVFIDRTGDLIFTDNINHPRDSITDIPLQIALIEKLLREGDHGNTVEAVFIKDNLTPAHIALLSARNILPQITLDDSHERSIKLTLKDDSSAM